MAINYISIQIVPTSIQQYRYVKIVWSMRSTHYRNENEPTGPAEVLSSLQLQLFPAVTAVQEFCLTTWNLWTGHY